MRPESATTGSEPGVFYGAGTVLFKVTSSGQFTTLYSLGGGGAPLGQLLRAQAMATITEPVPKGVATSMATCLWQDRSL